MRCLTIHARYGCRHRGRCCTAGWPIPVEEDRLQALAAAVENGRLAASSARRPLWLRPADAPRSTPAQLQVDEHGCVFYDPSGADHCRIHRALGHEALPLACRQFPRVSVVDPRGASVTLSHYCPTAAGLLDEQTTIAITDDPPAFPAGGEIVGLDARTDLPPLLTPDMLMDWEAWWEWERRAIDAIAQADSAASALATLSAAVEAVRDWTPGRRSLVDAVADAFTADAPANRETPAFESLIDGVLAAVPADLRPGRVAPDVPPSPAALRAFLAAHAFANWTAHLGQGLRSWLRSLDAAVVLANELGVGQADLLLRHLTDPVALARAWSRAEASPRP
jgi:hypothetical protein